MISIVICSIHPVLDDVLLNNISNTIGCPFEIVFINNEDNKHSLFSAYNYGVQESHGDIICFMHEDIEYLSNNWGQLVEDLLNSRPSIGACAVAGANMMRFSPSFYSVGSNGNRINLVQHIGEIDVEWEDYSEPTNLAVFDGLWFCIKKECFETCRFDESTYSGFHYYDIDISTQILNNGYSIMGVPGVKIKHSSVGNINEQWFINSYKYAWKWRKKLPIIISDLPAQTYYKLEKEALYEAFKGIFRYGKYGLVFKWLIFWSRFGIERIGINHYKQN